MNGIINFIKPPGMSSNGAVGFFKKILNTRKIGHAGTLDPGACGVLVILVGKATKLSDMLMDKPKEYIGEITFGAKTDTQDSYGVVISRDHKVITKKMIEEILPEFIGEIDQTPSRYSAIRVNGKKAYELARKGEDFKLKSRKVMIYDLSILNKQNENSFLIKVNCSKGTYIRALFEDIGKRLNTDAYMSFLIRTKSGNADVHDAVLIDEAKAFVENNEIEKMMTSIEYVLADYPKAIVSDKEFKRISNGLDASVVKADMTANKEAYRIYCKDTFFGLGIIKDGKAKITKHLIGDK